MRASFLAPAVALLMAVPSAAAPSDSDYSTKETRALMHAYARCVVRRHPAKAAEAIATNADNAAILRHYRALIDDECLTRQVTANLQMRFTGDLYRYALADALVNREFAAQDLSDLSAVPRLDHRDPGEPPPPAGRGKKGERKYREAREAYELAASYALLSRYGECVVRLDPSGAKAVLLTEPDSADETTRFNAIRTALARCLPEGRTVAFGRVALRGSIAVNYYRLAHSARSAAGGGASS